MTHSLAVEELVNATSEELDTYLRSGVLNTDALTRSLGYEGLDIEDWERIKRIHFCLADDVRDFISALSDRVRRIKTERQRKNIHTQGEVHGSINWSATLRTRSKPDYADHSRFVCNTPCTEYDIAENCVLKRLLRQIHRTVTDELQSVEHDWRQEFWTDDQLASFDRLYKQNVHLSRIKEGPAISVSRQDMTTVRQSRLPLYTEVYDLYDTFQRFRADTLDADITELLADTLVVPTDTPTLFELFCYFRLTRTLIQSTPGFVLKPIDGGSDALAHPESDDTRIEIHHDSTGSLSFYEPLDTTHRPVHAQYTRHHDALIGYSDTSETLIGDPSDPVLYNGRPDIIIEIYDTTSDERLDSVLLGEIKHSDTAQTFKQGLKELLTYRRFASKDNYLIDKPDITLTNLLITNGVTTSGISDEVIHLNGTDLIDSPATHSRHLDWIHSLSGLPATPSQT